MANNEGMEFDTVSTLTVFLKSSYELLGIARGLKKDDKNLSIIHGEVMEMFWEFNNLFDRINEINDHRKDTKGIIKDEDC